MTGGILALDIATVTGFAYAPPEAVAAWPDMGALGDYQFAAPPLDRIVWGSQRFGTPGCDPGLMTHEAHFWLTAQLHHKERRPALVVIEAPLPLGHMTKIDPRTRRKVPLVNTETQRKLGGLYGIFDLVRFRADVRWAEYGVSSIRLHFIGDGRASKKRDRIIKRCLDRGWDVGKDHNAADALAVLDYAVAIDRRLVKKTDVAGAALEQAAAAVEQAGGRAA